MEISQILSEVEPFKDTVDGTPVKRVTYAQNYVLIEWFTQRELDNLRILDEDWDI